VGGAVAADHRDGVLNAGSLGLVEFDDIALDPVDQLSDPGDLLLGGGGVGARPLVDAVEGGGQPFPGAQQILEVGLQVGQMATVVRKWSHPTQRNRTGQAPPPACTLDGSLQVP
jgi:hypothetical protein